ncbi:BatA domain-containing protein [Hymenobacter sp. HSC-4F20]|uniref:BatA domain-containing protein n=1 Tax=Hymenobacter sp. HSC-4F20 TaxID=2864135 RepID=UPI001C737F8A|nr:BatA domain-containing protein [Hymenobacter sp. HSC-4F20]MBX0292626.1 BatA domain-containing protein [Hymenobacter sp. HSC-4F20]
MPSLFFLHASAGWLALLGLAVPLAIYLWNRRPGRVVPVGSLRWLEAAANQRLRSIKPEQVLLLLLRAGILGLLALALAGPAQRRLPLPRRGQVLLSPAASPAQLATVRPLLDSLRRRGYELRYLGSPRPGLPTSWAAVGLADARTADTTAVSLAHTPATTPLSLWSSVQQAADSLPGRPLVVVAPLTLEAFRGSRPALPATVRWVPLPPADSVTWPVAAWRPHPDSLVLLLAAGAERSTVFRRIRRAWPTTSGLVSGLGTGVTVDFDAQRQQLTTLAPGGARRALPLLTRPLRLAVSTDATHAPAAEALTAALRAAGSVLPLPPRLRVTTTSTIPDSLDWLFWLREAPLPAEWARRVSAGLQIWEEARGRGQDAADSYLPPGSTAPIRLLRLDTARRAGIPRWASATNRPLLTARTEGRGSRYYLHTRPDPQWSELADSPELPALLLPLLLPASLAAPGSDPRPMPLRQLSNPFPTQTATPAAEDKVPLRDLTPWLVAAAGLLFALERLLAARRLPGRLPAA